MTSGSHALDEAVRNQTKILFPQFSDEATTKLFQLLRQDPQPSESSLSVWATQLRLDLGEVKNWTIIAQDLLQKHPIPIKQEKQPFTPSSHNQSSPPFARAPYPSRNVPVQQLPTPASSISPEPLSPQLARAQAVPQPSQPLPLPAAQLVGLADVLNDALHQDPSTVFPKPPQSLDEFARMMEPHNKRSSDFLRRITSGEYEEFGLKASFVKPL
ncbi:hypothetical protein K474DRAFT_1656040 [Panus rudis PR-1116 ss-1]|nr:hypothetical protein K474DRAFT_1656040 [Panus rudis PR-1116 ss-1]